MDAVRFEKVTKTYPYQEITADGRARLRRKADAANDPVALKRLTLTIEAGQGLGVLGKPGSGRTTFLGLVGGLLRPTRGTVLVRGRATGLIGMGAGFTGDLSVRENVLRSGMLLGEPREAMASRVDAILEMADLTEQADLVLRRLNTAQTKKLGWCVALHTEPEVFLADEEVVIGGPSMRDVGLDRLEQVTASGRTLVVATNKGAFLTRLCTRGIVLDEGRLVFDGPIDEALRSHRRAGGVEEPDEDEQPAPDDEATG
jgi:ABC-type polysaccharide/polyol phosphate transport system ATPase subunit